ncbi:hypothetical protein GGR56DRAFT_650771 [Xylariaceae sp. FL0804]|nr:hypothetical protein GGR56DRAFT_650771 [Xylariaceae sp. FL0804]
MTSLYDRRHDLAGLDVTTSMQPPCPTEPLSVWFTGNNDPWIPSGLTSGQDDARPSSAQVVPDPRAQSFSFAGHHRGSVVPSECDTMPPGAIPSDSAYGSYNTMPSVATGSVCDESYNRNAGAQSHVADLNYPQSIPDMLPKDGMFPPASWGHPPGHPPDRQLHLDSSLVCQTCHKSVKTGSELK